MAWKCEIIKQNFVEMASFDGPPCMDIPHKFYTSNFFLTEKNLTTDNCRRRLRNLVNFCPLSWNWKVLGFTPLLFLLVCSDIHNHRLCCSSHPNFDRPNFHCSKFHRTSSASVLSWTPLPCWLVSSPELKWNIEDKRIKIPLLIQKFKISFILNPKLILIKLNLYEIQAHWIKLR